MDKKKLSSIALRIRKNAVAAVHAAKSGHPGGSLGIAELLAYLYFEEMNVDPKNPKWDDRDRFVLSKGHTCPAYYAALAEKGFFDTELLLTFRKPDSILQGHPDMKHIPGVDMSTGSLGQGISAACGMALSGKIRNKNYRVYAILGDGESEEGQVWEAAMMAAHYNLSNLCIFVDSNGLQIDGPVAEVMNPQPFDEKFKAFGWNVCVIDGHDLDQIAEACKNARSSDKPTAVICNTVKGKGVSYMENNVAWHGSAPNDEQYSIACADLEKLEKELNA